MLDNGKFESVIKKSCNACIIAFIPHFYYYIFIGMFGRKSETMACILLLSVIIWKILLYKSS